MKSNKLNFFISFIGILSVVFVMNSCIEVSNNVPGEESGGLIETNASGNNFPPTNEALARTFAVENKVYQGNGGTAAKVTVYKQYGGSLGVSNTAELLTYDVTDAGATNFYNYEFDFLTLIAGLTIDGVPLSDVPFTYAVGDAWTLTHEVVLSDGTLLKQSPNTNASVSVSGRYAGTYTVIESDYWRIGVQSGLNDWTGCTREIISLAPGVYMNSQAFGPFTFTGCISDIYGTNPCPDTQQWIVIDLDEETGAITYPREYTFPAATADALGLTGWDCGDGLVFSQGEDAVIPITGLGDEFQDCDRNPGAFTNVSCVGMNVAIPNNVTGEDTIKMIYGYLVTGSGVREYREVLVKNVN